MAVKQRSDVGVSAAKLASDTATWLTANGRKVNQVKVGRNFTVPVP